MDNIIFELQNAEPLETYISKELCQFHANELLKITQPESLNASCEAQYTYLNSQHMIKLKTNIFGEEEIRWKHAVYHELMHYYNCCHYPIIRDAHSETNVDYSIYIPRVYIIELMAWLKSYTKYQIDYNEYLIPMQENLRTGCFRPQDIYKLIYNFSIICAISIYQRQNHSSTLIQQLNFPNERLKTIFIDLFAASWRCCKNGPTNETLQELYQGYVFPASQAIGRYYNLLRYN